MKRLKKYNAIAIAIVTAVIGGIPPAFAQEKAEFKVGNIVPYSGPAAVVGAVGRVQAAYFKRLNDNGGIRGRKINFISYDDAANPSKTVEQVRKLVEGDEVAVLLSTVGTATNSAIYRYLNSKKLPQLFVLTGASKFADPKGAPWTIGWVPTYDTEARIYAKYILEHHPNAKIAIFSQNDDFGKDLVAGFKARLGNRAEMIVAEDTYEISEPTISTHIVKLKASGADVLLNFATQKFAAQAIKATAELGWKPVQFVVNASSSVAAVLKPAGLEASQGILTTAFLKDASDPAFKDDPAVKNFLEFMRAYYPEGDTISNITMTGYAIAQTFEKVLQNAGDDVSRESIMRAATSLKDIKLDLLLDGIEINTSPDDYRPIKQMQVMKFQGESWRRIGTVVSGE
ncbi:ABC transporter substrate-binding protein [Bradyrhizobium sp. JYMT SZCCT0428]|uniref:ABC transporter substrate-binding protein n=1 Tax=Bradyrhizobium sp. JYMT SZCCT0428 TaxID=2807673 RepID=UPI001BA58865|nr:ABC transporter substrate-binding protein [Bradyrhizobium sp. JYMT SZCCT0428]MBR1156626.1 ABC transporter substrate-binding protein [Bradyrhizobium sp. JYMT SZCCT0428]